MIYVKGMWGGEGGEGGEEGAKGERWMRDILLKKQNVDFVWEDTVDIR